MSGGSYNYLCWKDVDEIMTGGRDDLTRMAERLAQLGYAEDAASETQAVLMDIRAFMVRTSVSLNRLGDVWKAVEWWDSADWGEDRVREALARYRGETP